MLAFCSIHRETMESTLPGLSAAQLESRGTLHKSNSRRQHQCITKNHTHATQMCAAAWHAFVSSHKIDIATSGGSRPDHRQGPSRHAPDKVTDVRDVHSDVEGAVSVRRHGQRVVQIPRPFRIDREHALASQIHAAVEVVGEAAQGWQLCQYLSSHVRHHVKIPESLSVASNGIFWGAKATQLHEQEDALRASDLRRC